VLLTNRISTPTIDRGPTVMSRLPEQLTASRPAVCVRAADERDHASIRALLWAAYAPYAPHVPAPVFLRYLSDLLDLERHATNGQLLVAEDDDRIVGCAAFYPDAGRLGFGFPAGWASGRGLAVDPTARGRGVARALITACERVARADLAPVFAFHTAGFMTTAIALYDRLGYQRAPEYDVDLAEHFGFDGFDPIPVIAYRRDLVTDPVLATLP
jgi:GNAT superfamily N-acetyltransferase